MSDTNIIKLVNKLNMYREKYYNEGISLISDEEFDFEERRLKELDPNNEYFLQVGKRTTTKDIPVEHEVPMLSMQKVQTAQDAIKWCYDIIKIPGLRLNTNIPIFWVDPKLDGISGKLVYDSNGKFKYASTRGDGQVGAIIPVGCKIDGVPKNFMTDTELRGEFIINKKYQKFYNGPLRNTCNGLLKRMDVSDEEIKRVSFVIYDVHNYKKSNEIHFKDRGEKLSKIEEILKDNNCNNYHIVPLRKVTDINKAYDDYVNNWRDSYEYETDGMILTVDGGQENYDIINSKYKITSFNRFNMALKPPAECASSKVSNILVSVKRMKLSFVAEFPSVFINGINVEHATLDNYQMMKNLKVGIGSTVLVKRTNDVIPKIVKAYNEVGENITYIDPKVCPCCGTELVKYNQDIMCPNEYGCKDIFISKLNYMLGNLNIKNIGLSTINKFVEFMIEDKKPLMFSEFFRCILDESVLNSYMDRLFNDYTSKSAKRFIDSINFVLNNKFTEVTILGSFNIPFIGESQLINVGIKSYESFVKHVENLSKTTLIDKAVDSNLFRWYQDDTHRIDLRETMELLKPYFKELETDDGKLTYCISGEIPGYKHKQDLINELKDIRPDCTYVDSVSLGLSFLISYEHGTTKVLKANKYKIPIYTVEEVLSKK